MAPVSSMQKTKEKYEKAGFHKEMKQHKLHATHESYQEFDKKYFAKAIHAADDKAAKLKFRMEKKRFCSPPPALLGQPMESLPLAFGASAPRKKKGSQKNQGKSAPSDSHN